MKSGASSSQQDFTDLFLDKYTPEEHQQFQEILKAFFSKNTPLVLELRAKLSNEGKEKVCEYINDWKKVDLKKWNSMEERIEKNIKNLKQQLKDLDKTKTQMEEKKKELFQNYAKNPANIAHMTKNEPATKSSAGISSFFNKLKR